MTNSFTYDRGVWKDGMPLPELEEMEDYDDYLKRIGYSRTSSLTCGIEDFQTLELYESNEGETYFVSVCPVGGRVCGVYLPDFPSMMMFMEKYAPVFLLSSMNDYQDRLNEAVDRLFRVYHGHSSSTVCDVCDPEETDRLRELLRKSRERAGKK